MTRLEKAGDTPTASASRLKFQMDSRESITPNKKLRKNNILGNIPSRVRHKNKGKRDCRHYSWNCLANSSDNSIISFGFKNLLY